MIFDNMEFFNVDNLQAIEGMNGLRLNRFPVAVAAAMGHNIETNGHANGRFRALRTQGCEIRFVTPSVFFDITLTSLESETRALIFLGDNFHSSHILQQGATTCLHIERHEVYKNIDLGKKPHRRFANNVWRVLLSAGGKVFFNFIDTFGFDRRPPTASEKPALRMAAYGSSITCGSNSLVYTRDRKSVV